VSTNIKIFVRVFVVAVLGGLALGGSASAQTYTTNGNGGSTDVGAWYMAYYCVTNAACNIPNNWIYYGMNYLPLESWSTISGSNALSGTYETFDSTDTAVIDQDLQTLAAAKVDFIVIDLTNGGFADSGPANAWTVTLAQTVAGEVAKWNANNGIPSGTGNNWKIKYAIAVNEGLEAGAADVYNSFFSNSTYGGSNYYQINGKQLVVNIQNPGACTGTCTYSNQTFWGFGVDQGAGQWAWQLGVTQPDPSGLVDQVGPGWNNYINGSYCYTGGICQNFGTPYYQSRGDGANYATNWNVVFNNTYPRVVFLTSFNEFQEDTGLWQADTATITYPPSPLSNPYDSGDSAGDGGRYPELWTAPDGLVHNDMYWNYTVSAINYLRNGGTKPYYPQIAPNLAPEATATASSTVGSGWAAANVNDGNPASAWSSQMHTSADNTEWIQLHNSSNPTFNTVVLMGRTDVPNCFPVSFQIQVWNGSTWLTRVQETNFPQPTIPGTPIAFTWGSADTTTDVRVLITQLSPDQFGNYYAQLGEFMVLNEGSTATAPMFANWGFEAPNEAGGYAYNPSGGSWTFSANSGLQGNGSAWGAAQAPQGVQSAFLQQTGTISQTVNFPAGNYTIRFLAAQRTTTGNAQGIAVTVDSANVGTWNPVNQSGNFTSYVTNSFNVSAGNHTITFSGTGYGGGDETAFIDAVQIFNQQN
jgi:hypothetical protein